MRGQSWWEMRWGLCRYNVQDSILVTVSSCSMWGEKKTVCCFCEDRGACQKTILSVANWFFRLRWPVIVNMCYEKVITTVLHAKNTADPHQVSSARVQALWKMLIWFLEPFGLLPASVCSSIIHPFPSVAMHSRNMTASIVCAITLAREHIDLCCVALGLSHTKH